MGTMKKKSINSLRTPVYRDAGFELYDAQTAASAFINENNPEREPEYYIYSRYRNPTVVACEEEIRKLEGSFWALLTQTGMSAIDIAVSIFQSAGDNRAWLFFSEIYGGTLSYTEEVLRKRRGKDVRNFYPKNERYDLEEFDNTMRNLKPALVYVETLSNPMLIVPDVKEIVRIAKEHGARIIVDNTFATPLLWKPLEDGADLVIYSATKYFSGHGNLTAGIICGNEKALFKDALDYRRYTGHMLSPDDAYRLQTQMKTLKLRFRQQNFNAATLASILSKSEKVRKVWYPGLADHPTYAEARALFGGTGYGGMITFDFAGRSNEEKSKRRDEFISYVSDFIKLVPSLGDPATILLPVESAWGIKYPEPGMIRMSAGFEDTEELSSIIKNALGTIS